MKIGRATTMIRLHTTIKFSMNFQVNFTPTSSSNRPLSQTILFLTACSFSVMSMSFAGTVEPHYSLSITHKHFSLTQTHMMCMSFAGTVEPHFDETKSKQQ